MQKKILKQSRILMPNNKEAVVTTYTDGSEDKPIIKDRNVKDGEEMNDSIFFWGMRL